MARKKVEKTVTPAEILAGAINKTGVAGVVRASSDAAGVKVLYRVGEKRTWLAILEYVLARADDWSAHVCQQYFMRGGKLVYGWNFILQSHKPEESVRRVAKLLMEGLKAAPKVLARRGSIDSFPLVGASPRRTASNLVFDPRMPGPGRGGPSHKGAYGIREGG